MKTLFIIINYIISFLLLIFSAFVFKGFNIEPDKNAGLIVAVLLILSGFAQSAFFILWAKGVISKIYAYVVLVLTLAIYLTFSAYLSYKSSPDVGIVLLFVAYCIGNLAALRSVK